MRVFISGGCKNGKSTFAQEIAFQQQRKTLYPLYYVATMESVDSEDDERIARHIADRAGMGFDTVEIGRDISRLVKLCNVNGSFLLDSITALLSNEMFEGGSLNRNAEDKLALELETVISAISSIVIVSDYIYADSKQYDSWTEEYRRALSRLDRVCAAHCDVVIEVCYGYLIFHKGKEFFSSEKNFESLCNGIEYVHNTSSATIVGR